MKTNYTQHELDTILDDYRATAVVKCKLIRPLVGGMPADDKGLEAFVKFHLKLEPGTKEFTKALARIRDEEIGEHDADPEEGELKDKETYGVNVIRRSEKGPFVLDHMIKAMLKQAASRLGFFMKKKGSKGDLAEMGTIRAWGESLQRPERPWEIYLRYNGGPGETSFKRLSGSVSRSSTTPRTTRARPAQLNATSVRIG